MNDRMTGLVRMLVEGYENCVALEGELGKFIGYFRLKKAVAGVEEVLEFLRPYAPWPVRYSHYQIPHFLDRYIRQILSQR